MQTEVTDVTNSARQIHCRPAVLFVVLAGGLGGSTRSVATVLGHLGHVTHANVHCVLAAPPRGRFVGFVTERHLTKALLPLPTPSRQRLRRLSRLWTAWRIAGWVRRNRRELLAIHANGPEELNVVGPAAWLYRVPVVVWSHARSASPWTRRLGRRWASLLPRRRFAAVSGFARRVLVDGGLASERDVEIVPDPIDPADVVGARSEHDGVVVGYLGSDAPYKGFQLLPGILAASGDAPISWLLFADEGPRSDALLWRDVRRAADGRVHVVGKVADVGSAYGRCDIVLIPSLEESFCRVAAEAMLNGLPVVASDLPPIRELLGDDEAGILFPTGDVRAAATAIRQLASDATLRESMGARGRERASAFDPVGVTAQLASLYGLPAIQEDHHQPGRPR